MKILQVGPVPPEVGGNRGGGVATHAWELATHLAKRGHKVAILCDNFPHPGKTPIVEQGVEIYGLSNYFLYRIFYRILSFCSLWKIMKLRNYFEGLIGTRDIVKKTLLYKYVIDEFKPNVIHVHHLEERFPFVYFNVKDKIPIISTIHSFNTIEFSEQSLREKYCRLVGKNLRATKNLILVSNFVKHKMEKLFGKIEIKYRVLYYPFDEWKYHRLPKEEACKKIGESTKVPIVLFVGALVERKGIYVLFKAIKILKEEGISLRTILVGNGQERGKIEKLIASYALEERVKLTGAKYYPELLYYFNASDLFVMPTFGEGFALVYIEAMLCGIPTIGTKGITDESIPSEDYGFLVPPGNADILAKAIKKGLEKEWDRKKIINYARSFSWTRWISKFEATYRDVAKGEIND